ncbi:MAG: hypothetical protein ACLQSR_09680 [Limisphaerales bacterium]
MVCVFLSVAGLSIRAAIVWDGPLIVYSQPTPDPTQVSNQDRITPDVWLTRTNSKGLFNAFSEKSAGTFSPTNTEWAFGSVTNCFSLHYTNWLTWLDGASPTTLVGQPVVLHLISDDIYLSLQFTFWASGGAGGFAYERSTPAVGFSGAKAINGRFSFNYTTQTNFTYVIQSSTNLVDWTAVSTNTANSGLTPFADTINPQGAEFYSVTLLPQQ